MKKDKRMGRAMEKERGNQKRGRKMNKRKMSNRLPLSWGCFGQRRVGERSRVSKSRWHFQVGHRIKLSLRS